MGIPSVTLPAAPGRLSTRETDPGNKLDRRMSGAEPAASSQQRIRRAKESVYFCHKQEDIIKLSSLDQQTCLCKGKFDTEYVLFTPHALPVK